MNIIEKNFNPKVYGKYAYLSLMDSISNINSNKSTFKYIQSNSPHGPWNIDKQLNITLEDPYPSTIFLAKVDGIIPEHLYAEAFSLKAISHWIQWLKKNHIYDNTMIVLVSDHGNYDNRKLAQAFGVDTKGIRSYTQNIDYPGRPSGLLLIKGFNEKGELKESSQFMSTADVPSIVCSVIGGCNDIPNDPRGIKENRSFYYSIGKWNPTSHRKNKFIIKQLYEVKSSMYNKENWKRVK